METSETTTTETSSVRGEDTVRTLTTHLRHYPVCKTEGREIEIEERGQPGDPFQLVTSTTYNKEVQILFHRLNLLSKDNKTAEYKV